MISVSENEAHDVSENVADRYYTNMDVRRAFNVLERQYNGFTEIEWAVVASGKHRKYNTTRYDTTILGIQMYSEADDVEFTLHKKFEKLSDLTTCIDATRSLSDSFGPMKVFNQFKIHHIVAIYGRTDYIPESNSSNTHIVIEIEPIDSNEEKEEG